MTWNYGPGKFLAVGPNFAKITTSVIALLLLSCGAHAQAIFRAQNVQASGGATPASFINSNSCIGTLGASNCVITPCTAIPFGSVIFALLVDSSNATLSVSDRAGRNRGR